MKALESSSYIDNNLPYGMESCLCESSEEFYWKMLGLKEVGYLFPDDVLDTILEEMDEEGDALDGN